MEEILQRLLYKALLRSLGDGASQVSIKIIGSIDDLAESLANARALTTAAKGNIGVTGNSILVGLGAYTGGNSALQYGITTDPKAKLFYALSTLCSASAITSGGIAVAARSCDISATACVSESIGIAFMNLGNRAHVMGLEAEGKPVPPRLRRYVSSGTRPLSFVNPQNMIGISGERIFGVITIGFSIYAYRKIIIKSYQYGQQFISKRKTLHSSKILKKQATFIIHRLNARQPVIRAKKVYKLAIG